MTEFIQRVPGQPSGIALIVVDAEGENSIVVVSGANASLGPERIRELEHLLLSADVVLLQLEIPIEAVVEAARIASAHGARVILNPAPGARPGVPHPLRRACASVTRTSGRATPASRSSPRRTPPTSRGSHDRSLGCLSP